MRTLMGATRAAQCSSLTSSTPTIREEQRSRPLCTGSLYNAPSHGITNPAVLLLGCSLQNALVLFTSTGGGCTIGPALTCWDSHLGCDAEPLAN